MDPDPDGSAFIWLSWIRTQIHIGNGSDSGPSKLINIKNKSGFLSFKKAFVASLVCFSLLSVYFSCENSTFCDLYSDQEPDPHCSVMVWLPGSETDMDPY